MKSPLFLLSLLFCSLACSILAPASYAVTNDDFANAALVSGTNVVLVGNMASATVEPGEYDSGYSNTIWFVWVPPFTGRAHYTGTVVDWAQPITVFTGTSVTNLTVVPWTSLGNHRADFLAVAGTPYYFQVAGIQDQCEFPLVLEPWPALTNDFFASAYQYLGQYISPDEDTQNFPIGNATTEPGEPEQLGGAPFKSLWWKWTAPLYGTASFNLYGSLPNTIILTAYTGDTLPALIPVRKGTNNVAFPTIGGQTYYIAAAVTTNTVGDVLLSGGMTAQSQFTQVIPGNIIQNASWENGVLPWGEAGAVGNPINYVGPVDGTHWPTLATGAQVWQDIPTVPGKKYSISFATRALFDNVGSAGGDAQIQVLWNNQPLAIADIPDNQLGFWNWPVFTATATNTTTRVAFTNLARAVEMDMFSVVAQDASPAIVNPPASAQVAVGGTATFTVGASGTQPLTYQWFFNGSLYATLDAPLLILDTVTTNQAGSYVCVITNAYGAITSAPVDLAVESSLVPLIIWQPYGAVLNPTNYYSLSVVAIGANPLTYQWTKNGVDIPAATNHDLTFVHVDYSDAGTYAVRVQNALGSVTSIDARIDVTNSAFKYGWISFNNTVFFSPRFVYDIDGLTPLGGSNYKAQLYVGQALASMRSTGEPATFFDEVDGWGYFDGGTVVLTSVGPGSNAVFQVRAWDSNKGSTYEEARARGGKFGSSEMFTVKVTGSPQPPPSMDGFKSFSLQAGLPGFTTGRITFVETQTNGVTVWAHAGQTGYRYLIEKATSTFDWNPYTVITNSSPTVNFTDTTPTNGAPVFYRSRLLD